MVSQELLEAYERLLKRKELNEGAIKTGNLIQKLAVPIIIISFIYIIVSTTFNLPHPDIEFAGGLILAVLVSVIGQKIIDRKTHLAPFFIEEQEFLNAVDSLKYIETFQKDGIEYSRTEAAERLSKFEEQLAEPKFEGELWKNLTKEANENIRLLKQNFNERLIPSITQGKKEEINKVSSIIEKFAKYLLNPTVSEVKDLNKSMLELNLYQPEKSRIVSFLGHPYMRHACFLVIFIVCGIFAYYLSKQLGSTNDSAISSGIYVPVALIAGYMIFMVKKS
ncbi:MAG: hypothetical protein O8C62_10355 [Candidatus Methanoperedens sp.]|nr:hypothetical protein [Candidatus Methanoperedens sp.]